MRTILAMAIAGVFVAGACASDDPLPEVAVFGQDEAEVAADGGEGERVSETDPVDAGVDDALPPQNPAVRRPTEFEDLTGQNRVEVEVADNVYRTRNFVVDPGTEIVFVNVGANPHNVVPAAEGAFPKIPEEALEEGPAALVLDVPGDYPFYCSIHGGANWGQTGFVVVAEAA